MLLYVVDAGSPNRNEQVEEVNKVLKEIDADATPQILVLNKIDLFNLSAGAAGYERDECGRMIQVRLSAKIGEGLEFIKLALAEEVEQRASQQYRIQSQVGNAASRCASVSY